ncbi:MAG TPA: hypothetical protein VJB70_00175 [Candidatus Paceibacterota bacterium]
MFIFILIAAVALLFWGATESVAPLDAVGLLIMAILGVAAIVMVISTLRQR